MTDAVRLSGGASQETWSFDIVHPDGNIGAILRRAPPGYGAAPSRAAGLDAEATLMQLAHDAGVPSPRVLHVLEPQDELGTGFIMERIEGETIPRKILRDEQFAQARPKLARQLGGILAGIHGLPLPQLPELRRMTAAKEIAELERDYRSFDWPRPVFELALRWLRDHDPGPSAEVTLVHGDFRHGNLDHRPRRRARGAGLGARASRRSHGGSRLDLRQFVALRRDRQAGRRFRHRAKNCSPDMRPPAAASIPTRVMFWEVMGTLRWGVMCCGMMQRFRTGPDHSIERAMIGRRSSETEIDLLRLLAPRHRVNMSRLTCRTNRHRKN